MRYESAHAYSRTCSGAVAPQTRLGYWAHIPYAGKEKYLRTESVSSALRNDPYSNVEATNIPRGRSDRYPQKAKLTNIHRRLSHEYPQKTKSRICTEGEVTNIHRKRSHAYAQMAKLGITAEGELTNIHRKLIHKYPQRAKSRICTGGEVTNIRRTAKWQISTES
jgi:hypothetical protein